MGKLLVGLAIPIENKSGLFWTSFVAVFITQKAQVHARERYPGSWVSRYGLLLMTLKWEAWPGGDGAGLEALSLGVVLAGRCPALSFRLV